MFPDHPPKVVHCVRQRTLRQNVLPSLCVPLPVIQYDRYTSGLKGFDIYWQTHINEAGIDVVSVIHIVHLRLETYSVPVVCV